MIHSKRFRLVASEGGRVLDCFDSAEAARATAETWRYEERLELQENFEPHRWKILEYIGKAKQ